MSFEQEYFLVLLLECLFQFLLLIMCLLYYFFSYQTLFCRLNLSFFPSSLQSYSSLSIGDHIYFLVLCDCVIRLLQFHLLCFSKLHSVLLIPAHLQLFQFRRVFLSFSMIFSLFFWGDGLWCFSLRFFGKCKDSFDSFDAIKISWSYRVSSNIAVVWNVIPNAIEFFWKVDLRVANGWSQ